MLLLDGNELHTGDNVEWHELPDSSRVLGWLSGTAKGKISGNASPGQLFVKGVLSELEDVIRVTSVLGTNSGPLNGGDSLVGSLVSPRGSHTEWLSSEDGGSSNWLAAKQESVGRVDLGPGGKRVGSVGLTSGDSWSELGALVLVNASVALVSRPDSLARDSGGGEDDLSSSPDILGERGVGESDKWGWNNKSLDVSGVVGLKGPSIGLGSWVGCGALGSIVALEDVFLVTEVFASLDGVFSNVGNVKESS